MVLESNSCRNVRSDLSMYLTSEKKTEEFQTPMQSPLGNESEELVD